MKVLLYQSCLFSPFHWLIYHSLVTVLRKNRSGNRSSRQVLYLNKRYTMYYYISNRSTLIWETLNKTIAQYALPKFHHTLLCIKSSLTKGVSESGSPIFWIVIKHYICVANHSADCWSFLLSTTNRALTFQRTIHGLMNKFHVPLDYN